MNMHVCFDVFTKIEIFNFSTAQRKSRLTTVYSESECVCGLPVSNSHQTSFAEVSLKIHFLFLLTSSVYTFNHKMYANGNVEDTKKSKHNTVKKEKYKSMCIFPVETLAQVLIFQNLTT